jgi:phenylpropionate dioxygenase-like ring-hydroxylating dioxygenase large terminal subunit
MELATALTGQTVRADIRQIGINPNHWYAVGWARDIKPNQVICVTLWQQTIALYREASSQLHALRDRCPHRGVELHRGKVNGNHLMCRYHGWEFNGQGECVRIPYWPAQQKLPCAQVRTYPVQEKYGLIWVFPGDPSLADARQIPEIPEFSEPGWFMVPVSVHFQAHFTICNENTMDVFHGILHQELQGWFDPVLISLQETETSVRAEYQVSYQGRLASWLGLSDRPHQPTTRSIHIEYRYPHFRTHMPGISALYLMRLPIGLTESRSYALFFFKVRLPTFLLRWLQPFLQWLLNRFVLLRFVNQDKEMVESEQRTHLAYPGQRYVEINPAIIALQRLMMRQYKQIQPSGSSPATRHKTSTRSISARKSTTSD